MEIPFSLALMVSYLYQKQSETKLLQKYHFPSHFILIMAYSENFNRQKSTLQYNSSISCNCIQTKMYIQILHLQKNCCFAAIVIWPFTILLYYHYCCLALAAFFTYKIASIKVELLFIKWLTPCTYE